MFLQRLTLYSNHLSSTLPISCDSASSALANLSVGNNCVNGAQPTMRKYASPQFSAGKVVGLIAVCGWLQARYHQPTPRCRI